MTKYVIDLPDGISAVVAKKSSFLNNETDVMRIPVSQLEMYVEPTVAEDATVEKRVIELPADEIKLLVEHKRGRSIFGFLNYLINETGDPSLITELTDELETTYISITQDVLSEWYLGHVEFVPKKEQKFYVIIPHFDREVRYALPDTEYVDFATKNRAGKFTKEDADELVAGLTALNARKVKVEE